MLNKKTLLIGLLIPIFTLMGLALNYQYEISNAREIILPISNSYSSNHRLFSKGYFFKYDINYNVENICDDYINYRKSSGYICLEPKRFSYSQPENCEIFIKGECNYSRFSAGTEDIYISENLVEKFNEIKDKKNKQVLIAVTKNGLAYVKSLLIDDKPWKP